MNEHRRLVRTRVSHPAKVLAEDKDVLHDCIVDNLTTLGACIMLDSKSATALPSTFELTFDRGRTLWDCHLVWKDSQIGRLGISWKKS
jgi:hypothetical protein